MDYFFHTDELTVGYDGKPLIKDIEIRLEKGRILTLIGPNGAGKSTILKTIAKYLKSICGAVYIGGGSVAEMSDAEMSHLVSVVLTQRMRTELMTCAEVVETGRYPYTGRLGILSDDDRAEVRDAMEIVNVWDLRERDFMQISDGQRQRVLLARAICQRPQMIVLDEPTSFLDVRYQLELLQTLRDMARERNIAVVMSLHELALAQRISDDVLCVKGENITHYGPAREIFTPELVNELYDLRDGSYDTLFGSLEMRRPEGEPKLFVIAGGGTGADVYRGLQKSGTPFYTGVLSESDVDCRIASALAAKVVTEKAFCRISDAAFAEALELLQKCGEVVDCLSAYGETNSRNAELFERAKKLGLTVRRAEELV